ncbi:hypothetical protein [uncultured Cocleimonas sp.]|uniref:hypothetical protein n=1 Tax=uncultured Cocleimonas sp. TaxID=1051587 RepID=UPI0026371169|nr:hypothetical protein [uncultured Cocleimonas sp.]
MKKLVLFLLILLSLVGCGSGSTSNPVTRDNVTQEDVVDRYAIDYLSNKSYIFSAINPDTRELSYQSLERFDLIFVGYDLYNSSSTNDYTDILARAIPGIYTHMLMYIGKDSDGFAYAVEINSTENQSYTLGLDGLNIDGNLFVYCLGADFAQQECPEDRYIHGLEKYDYMWAKQLVPDLKKSLFENEAELISTIKQHLINEFPSQIPFHIGPETKITKVIPLVDDGLKNGADCTAYIVSLFEEVAEVCLDDVRINAAEGTAYYLDDPIGQETIIPEEYNIFSEGDLYFSEVLTTYGYSFVDNFPRKTSCPDSREVVGIPLPDLVFNSPSLMDVPTVE